MVISIGIGAVGLVERVGYLFPLLLIAGAGVGVVNVTATTLMTLRTPEAKRGRMFAASSAVFTSAEIAATAFGGLILTVLAPRTVFQIAGVVSTVVVVLMGPFALRASRAAKASEEERQGA